MFIKKKGFTLIELIIVIALAGIISTICFSMIKFGSKSLSISQREYNIQSSERLVALQCNESSRYATALFAIPKTSFRQNNLTKGWNYIGVEEIKLKEATASEPAVYGSEIVNYTYDAANNTHIRNVIAEAQKNVNYSLIFEKPSSNIEDNLLKLTIKCTVDGSNKDTLATELEALNSLQVVSYGTASNPATALAYRKDERTRNVVGHVAMVLDTSGSMNYDMNGNYADWFNWDKTRIRILRSEAKTLIKGFAKEDNIDVCLVPFASSANKIKTFKNAKTQTNALISDVDNLDANGGTNTGDGLRRAYHALKNHNLTVSAGITASNYLIVLVDGVTTFASVNNGRDRNYLIDDGNINEGFLDRWQEYNPDGQVIGNGSSLDSSGTEYVNLMGNFFETNNFAKVFVIGFSNKHSDLESVNDIASACGASNSHVYRAGDEGDLNDIFTTIKEEIVNDLWYLQGPDL